MSDKFSEKLMLKASTPMNEGCSYSFLKQLRMRETPHKVALQMSSKYVDKMKSLLGLEDCKPVATPGTKDDANVDETPLLDSDRATTYKTCNGILQYVSRFRPDLQYCIKELAQSL